MNNRIAAIASLLTAATLAIKLNEATVNQDGLKLVGQIFQDEENQLLLKMSDDALDKKDATTENDHTEEQPTSDKKGAGVQDDAGESTDSDQEGAGGDGTYGEDEGASESTDSEKDQKSAETTDDFTGKTSDEPQASKAKTEDTTAKDGVVIKSEEELKAVYDALVSTSGATDHFTVE